MITFKDFLLEIGKSDVPYDVIISSNDHFVTNATIGDREISFDGHTDDEADGWHVEFAEVRGGKSTFKTTGSGHAFKVASFVTSSFNEMISRYAPSKIFFTSEVDEDTGDMSRGDVYIRMIKKHVKGYKVVRSEIRGGSEEITLTRT